MPEAVDALGERGVDITSHIARRLTRLLIEEADLVIAMAAEHRDAVYRLWPAAQDRTFTLKELVWLVGGMPAPARTGSLEDRLRSRVAQVAARRAAVTETLYDEDVADPLGLGLEAFRATAWELGELSTRAIDGLVGPAERVPVAAAVGPTPAQARPVEVGSSPGAAATSARHGMGGGPDAGQQQQDERREAMRDYAASWEALKATDPEVAQAVANELKRERSMLRLIASENYASPAVLAALASTMQNKYAEGYPGRRYYGGCEFVDVTETLAIERAKRLFGAEHANVQPHAGAQANLAVYGAFLEPNTPENKVLGLALPHGGHLTHGSPVNVSGKWFSFINYEVDKDTERIDMDRVRDLALEHRPRMILAGFTAYPRVIDFAAFRQIADEVGALFMVDAAHFIGVGHGAGIGPAGARHRGQGRLPSRSDAARLRRVRSADHPDRPGPGRRPGRTGPPPGLGGDRLPSGPGGPPAHRHDRGRRRTSLRGGQHRPQ